MKRGQIKQIFVWLLTLVVAVAIIFYGMKVITSSERLKDDVLVVKFFNDLDKKLSQYYYLDIGSNGQERFTLPSNVQYVCFVNDRTNWNPSSIDLAGTFDEDLMLSLGNSNVFIGPMSLYEENRYKLNTKFSVDNNPECFDIIGGVLRLSIENRGVSNGVQISG
jgi:hypothetical protein